MTNLDSILKKLRNYFVYKGLSSQSYGFSSSDVWMWELDHKEGWHWRTDVFELWCWRRLLRVSWTARRSIQSILKEMSPEYSLEGLMLNLKLQYFGHLMQRVDSLEKTLMLEKIEGEKRSGVGSIQSTWVWVSSGRWWRTGKPGMLQSMGSQRVWHDWTTTNKNAGFPGGSVVNNSPATQKLQEMWVQSLGQEDRLTKGMAIHYSILAWRIPWAEEPGGLQSKGLHRVRHDRIDLARMHANKLAETSYVCTRLHNS